MEAGSLKNHKIKNHYSTNGINGTFYLKEYEKQVKKTLNLNVKKCHVSSMKNNMQKLNFLFCLAVFLMVF